MTPEEILQGIQQRAVATLNASVVTDPVIRERVDYVCRCMSNRAGVRLLMSCLLGKLDKPNVDPRKPYTEIGGTDSFSGRTYDERHLTIEKAVMVFIKIAPYSRSTPPAARTPARRCRRAA
jgi:hypothetical protein